MGHTSRWAGLGAGDGRTRLAGPRSNLVALQTALLRHFIMGHTAVVRKAYMVLTERLLLSARGWGWRQIFPCIYSHRDMSDRWVPCGQGPHLEARMAGLFRKMVSLPLISAQGVPDQSSWAPTGYHHQLVALEGAVALPRKKLCPPFCKPSPPPLLGRPGTAMGLGRGGREHLHPASTARHSTGLPGGAGPRHQKRCRGWGPKCMGRLCSRGRWMGANS